MVLIKQIWPYYVAGIFIAILWLYLPNYSEFVNVAIDEMMPLERILLIVIVVPFLYIGTVSILQRNFNSIREVVSLIQLVFKKSTKKDIAG
jgi:hypothetical protein